MLTMLALGGLAAGSASAASWHINGKPYSGKTSFASEGSLTIEIPASGATFNCAEAGSGTISAGNLVNQEVTLSCVMVGHEKTCHFLPVNAKVGGSVGSYSFEPTTLTLSNTGEECSWYLNTEVKEESPFNPQYGPESTELTVAATATGSFGKNVAYFSSSSTWQLNGEYKGSRWGIEGVPTFSFSFGSEGSGNGQFGSPSYDAVGPDGSVWVVDKANSRVEKFNSKGEFLLSFGSSGTGNGQFRSIGGIAVTSKGAVWVVDGKNARVQKFNSEGAYQTQFGSLGSGNGQLSGPTGIAIDKNGNLWVVDRANHRVEEFSSNGEYLSKFGSAGSGNGQFGEEASGIAVDASGNIWVVDTTNNRVEKFNAEGKYVSQFGSFGTGHGQFCNPRGIAVDSEGNLWVTDENSRVEKFDSTGAYLGQFGEYGTGKGQLKGDYGIAVDAKGNLWVVDPGNYRVQNWSF